MPRSTLLMWSGGLDSTAILIKLLRETKDEVHTMYVDVENNGIKSWAEQEVIRILTPILRLKYRNFTHDMCKVSEVKIGSGFVGSAQPQMWLNAAGMGITHLNTNNRRRLILGYTRGDDILIRRHMLRSMWALICQFWVDAMIPLHIPLATTDKLDSVRWLKLVEKTDDISILQYLWTCENPIRVHSMLFSGYLACGQCQPCSNAILHGVLNRSKHKRIQAALECDIPKAILQPVSSAK